MRNGYWFDIDQTRWEALEFPPSNPIVDEPNSAFGFRGSLAIFGSPVCDSQGECRHTEVLQYDSSTDAWVSLGNMIMDRRFHDVVEVPVEWCDVALGESPTTTTPPTTEVKLAMLSKIDMHAMC